MTLNDDIKHTKLMKFFSAAFYAFSSFFIIVVNKSILTQYKWVSTSGFHTRRTGSVFTYLCNSWLIIYDVCVIVNFRFPSFMFLGIGQVRNILKCYFINITLKSIWFYFVYIHRWQQQSSFCMLPKWTRRSISRTLTKVFLARCVILFLITLSSYCFAYWLYYLYIDFSFAIAVCGQSRDRTGRNKETEVNKLRVLHKNNTLQ